MFKKINIPFYQNQWFGIKFLSLNTNKYLFQRANKNFYTNFYKEFKKKYKNINFINGGRYDKLISDLGGKKKIPAVGAAFNLF